MLTTKWNVEQWLANHSPKWGATQKKKDNHPRRKMQATSCSESGGTKNWAPSRPDNNKSWWPCRCSTVYCPVSNFEQCDNIGFQLWKKKKKVQALHERHWRIDYKLMWNCKPLNSRIHFYICVFFSFLSRSETWQVLEQSLMIFMWTSFWNIWCQSLTLYSVIYCKTVLFVYQSCKNEAGRFFYLIFRLHWHPNIQKVLPWAQ